MKAIEIDAGDGCVAPTPETIADGTYPFSRTLYIYVSKAAAESNPAVASFVDLYLSPEGLATVADSGLRRPPRRPGRRRAVGLGRALSRSPILGHRGRPLVPPGGRPRWPALVAAVL